MGEACQENAAVELRVQALLHVRPDQIRYKRVFNLFRRFRHNVKAAIAVDMRGRQNPLFFSLRKKGSCLIRASYINVELSLSIIDCFIINEKLVAAQRGEKAIHPQEASRMKINNFSTIYHRARSAADGTYLDCIRPSFLRLPSKICIRGEHGRH